jgi:hypothetical protein
MWELNDRKPIKLIYRNSVVPHVFNRVEETAETLASNTWH